jgi:hypothetical protein
MRLLSVTVCVESETLSCKISHVRAVLGNATPMCAHIRLYASCCQRRVSHILITNIPFCPVDHYFSQPSSSLNLSLSSAVGCSSCAFSSNASGQRRPLGHLVFEGFDGIILDDWERLMRARGRSVG